MCDFLDLTCMYIPRACIKEDAPRAGLVTKSTQGVALRYISRAHLYSGKEVKAIFLRPASPLSGVGAAWQWE